jgi:hypothetical protein
MKREAALLIYGRRGFALQIPTSCQLIAGGALFYWWALFGNRAAENGVTVYAEHQELKQASKQTSMQAPN